jgi:hypothetical protein
MDEERIVAIAKGTMRAGPTTNGRKRSHHQKLRPVSKRKPPTGSNLELHTTKQMDLASKCHQGNSA